MTPVLSDLCSIGPEEADKFDEAELGFTCRDWVSREGLPQERSDLAHPETFSDKNVTVTLSCI